ncbi:MAG: peptide chain release factor N(5)-glutamine methyltransferase [Oscillospiraceae bacterium]|nr:peptide chain release factor N(5)-glutamine methyltransferase [Oscillospiraceae bacterium]
MPTIGDLFRLAQKRAPTSFEAGELFRFATGVGPLDDWSGPATSQMQADLERCLELREGGYPIQYIVGGWEFYGLPLTLGPGVLIPRQDTETLIDLALEYLKRAALPTPEVVDLGSGSGCIAMAIKAEYPAAAVTAVEISEEATTFLERNISDIGLDVTAVLGDMREYTHPRKIDLLLSNPPYIPFAELPGLQREVLHEPTLALDGGKDGLDFYRAIAVRYKPQLAPGGTVLLEIGAGQRDDVCDILAGAGFAEITSHNDLNGLPRVIRARG